MRVPHLLRATGLCLALALTPGVADAAKAPAKAKTEAKAPTTRPAGGVKLTAATRQKIGKLTCGRVKGIWLPGSTVSGWFVTYQQQHVTAFKAAKKAKGAKRKALKRTAATRKRQAQELYAWCAPFNTRPNTGAQQTAPSPYYGPYTQPTADPVRVDVSGAIGLTLRGGAISQPNVSNLDALSRTGTLRDAVVSGNATVSQFLIAPDGSVYVLFASPVMLDVNAPSSLCVLARVVQGSTVPTCIDPGLYAVQWYDTSGARNPGIQFDASGGVYYLGYGQNGTVLRRFSGGTTTNLITDNADISDFLVLPDGRVLLSGSTRNTQAQWTRQLSTAGALSSLRAAQSTFMRRFPDGNVYLGVQDSQGTGVLRYDSATSAIEPTAWIARSSYGGPVAHHDLSPICDGSWDRFQGLCNSSGATISRVFTMADDRVFVLAGYSPGMMLAEYFPGLSVPDAAITRATGGASNGREIVLSGLDAAGKNVLGAHDATTGEDRQLIGPDGEIEIYHLDFTADGTTVLFDGLRFADNRYVIGQVDLATGVITAATPTQTKLAGLQAFR